MPISTPPAQTPVGQVICTQAGAYSFLGTKAGTGTVTNNRLRSMAVYVPESVTLDRIGCEVTTGGEAGCVVRLGIYADNGTSVPGSLVLDAGTVAADSTGVKEITISQALSPGVYHLVAAVQSAPTTQPTLRTVSEVIAVGSAGSGPNAVQNGLFGFLDEPHSGAFPASFTPDASSGAAPRIFVRTV